LGGNTATRRDAQASSLAADLFTGYADQTNPYANAHTAKALNGQHASKVTSISLIGGYEGENTGLGGNTATRRDAQASNLGADLFTGYYGKGNQTDRPRSTKQHIVGAPDAQASGVFADIFCRDDGMGSNAATGKTTKQHIVGAPDAQASSLHGDIFMREGAGNPIAPVKTTKSVVEGATYSQKSTLNEDLFGNYGVRPEDKPRKQSRGVSRTVDGSNTTQNSSGVLGSLTHAHAMLLSSE